MLVSKFLGIRNTEPIRSIPNNACSEAVNVDISVEGALSQRNGCSLAKSIPISTAYSTFEQSVYVVSNGILNRVQDDLTFIPICPSTATEFTDFGEVLFTNDGLKVQNNVATNIKVPSPEIPPDLSAISGNRFAGTYSVCYTYRSADGLEGGSSPISSIELKSVGGITIAPITAPAGFTVVIYITDVDGAVYYNSDGIQLAQYQILAQHFPDGVEQIAFHDSRLWVSQAQSNGSTVIWFSDPFLYHIYDAINGYIVVPGEVRGMMSANGGLIIGTNSVIYVFDGDVLTPLTTYGVIAGRPFARGTDRTVYMHTEWGVCKALPFANISSDKVSFPMGAKCSTALVYQDGLQKFVALSDGSGVPFNARY